MEKSSGKNWKRYIENISDKTEVLYKKKDKIEDIQRTKESRIQWFAVHI